MSGVAEAPRIVAEPSHTADDRRLVAAVRRGDDRAFEELYARYQRRIAAYVMGMVKDHGRAEDITQEVFVSALRRMRETERPIAFKPWVYEIAKNACIDQFRRSKRAEEVSLQADDGLAPADYGKLVGSDPSPDMAVAAKQDLDNLCGAFGGLSETHHEILVLRELEGMSYREIGERMGMSRPAVESTLFRARRRLTEEYDDLVSGARCQRIQGLIAAAVTTRLGTRESRRLSRHVAHCQPCRREALAAGLDSAILTHVPLPKRAAAKVASLLPFPLLGRWRGGDAATPPPPGPGWTAHVPIVSEQLSGGWGKLATAAAVVVAGVGAAGVGTEVVGSKDEPVDRDRPARQAGAPPKGDTGAAQVARTTRQSAQGADAERGAKGTRKPDRAGRRGERRGARDGTTLTSRPTGTADGAGQAAGGGAAAGAGGTGVKLPEVEVPAGGQDPVAPVREVVEKAVEPVQPVIDEVNKTVEQVTAPVQETVQGVQDTVQGVTGGLTGSGAGGGGGLPQP
ncbi:MAG TPA: sigma-70 family RNA polymerase sigma factor [Solirubrobacteraceae bacterium]|nr:sigma-70 family RNA polymerase sigma factor [Solirubrobacteraceae bacterium]